MREQISTINNDFINDFSNIYLDPSKVNKYLNNYSTIIEKDNIFGMQFHPEISQITGFKLMRRVLEEYTHA